MTLQHLQQQIITLTTVVKLQQELDTDNRKKVTALVNKVKTQEKRIEQLEKYIVGTNSDKYLIQEKLTQEFDLSDFKLT